MDFRRWLNVPNWHSEPAPRSPPSTESKSCFRASFFVRWERSLVMATAALATVIELGTTM